MEGEQITNPAILDVINRNFEVRFETPDDLINECDEGVFLFFVLWNGHMFFCDDVSDWAFSDFGPTDATEVPQGLWESVTPGFATLSDALDFPILDGSSIRERFSECRFFLE